MLSILMLLFLQGNFAALRLGSQGSFPKPLSAQEERLALEQAAAGDARARDRLIEHNLRLVAHIVKKYYTQTGGDSDDLISIGTVGLIKAVNTYNAEKKIKLATYAARCIENAILSSTRFRREAVRHCFCVRGAGTEKNGGTDRQSVCTPVSAWDTVWMTASSNLRFC